MSGLPVAGLVVVSDGADNAETTLDQSIAGLEGAGACRCSRSASARNGCRATSRSRAPRRRARVLKGASLVVDVVVTQSGYAGAKVPLIVEDDGRTVSTQEITLPADGESQTVKVRFKAGDAGRAVCSGSACRCRRTKKSRRTTSATRSSTSTTGPRRFSISRASRGRSRSSSGRRPRTIRTCGSRCCSARRRRRSTRRTSTTAAASTTPRNCRTDSRRRAKSCSSIRASSSAASKRRRFTPEQQRMLEDFVDVRGGGLLALGGLRSFSEGGWAGTPLSDALPIDARPARREAAGAAARARRPADARGQSHPGRADHRAAGGRGGQVEGTAAAHGGQRRAGRRSQARRDALLTGVDQNGREQVVLAYQRYGRGKTLVLPVQDTWMWRMHAKMAVEDTTHHNFWQRLTRWLVDGVPDRVMVSLDARPRAARRAGHADGRRARPGVPGRERRPHHRARDGAVRQASKTCRWSGPSSTTASTARGSRRPRTGSIESRSTGRARTGRTSGAARRSCAWRRATRSTSTPRCARRSCGGSSEETDGRFFRAADTAGLVDAITYSGRGVTVIEERELWDMPIVLCPAARADGRGVALPAGGEASRESASPSWRRCSSRWRRRPRWRSAAALAGCSGSYSGNARYDGKFVFVRMSYPGERLRRQPFWAHDYPDGEVHFMKILTAVSNVAGARRGDEHPGFRRSGDVQVPGDLPGGARLLEDGRRAGQGAARLPRSRAAS